ncbi:AtpZ/AtpI family protein [Candidatus Uhrbacteria bacterium]|nr:AtpZ/AtpI family protein [Candidatus Uhrbacteria bacterium]
MDKPKPKEPDIAPWQAVAFTWDLIIAIALPTVLFALLGRWLDARFGTKPLFIILGLIAALGIVSVVIVRKGKDIAKRLSS